MAPLTQRDRILNFMAVYTTEHHNAPSTYQIAHHFERCQTTICGHMKRLIAEHRLVLSDGHWKLIGASYTPPFSQTPV